MIYWLLFSLLFSASVISPFPDTLFTSPPCISMATVTSNSTSSARLPVAFVSHGGGPCFFIDGKGSIMQDIDMNSEAKRSLERLPKQLHAEKPSAIVMVTAHWEGDQVLVGGKDEYTSLYYDYGGFPDFTYKLEYRAPAEPRLAAQIVQMLTSKGIASKLDKKRDWDHGVFVPLKVMYPNADIPVVAVSIVASYDPATHIAIGKALAPLRDQNILILGSGFATHNFHPRSVQGNGPFADAVSSAVAAPTDEREKLFINWTKLPGARLAHASEDHLMPLHVIVGAAEDSTGKEVYRTSAAGGGMIFAHWGFGI